MQSPPFLVTSSLLSPNILNTMFSNTLGFLSSHKARNQNIKQNCSIKTDNKSFERAEHFKYLGNPLTNKNVIHEEIKSRLKSGNVCSPWCRIVCLSIYHPKI